METAYLIYGTLVGVGFCAGLALFVWALLANHSGVAGDQRG